MTPDTNDRSVVHYTGWVYYPIAFVARLPFAMIVVGVLTFVVAVTGSVATGGLTSAAVGIGVVVAGPAIGDLADRFGQRRVLVPVALVNGLLLAAFPLVVGPETPTWLILVFATVLGLTVPQTAAMSRSRLLAIIRGRLLPARRPRALSRVMAYESAADETVFIIGPVLVGILASLVTPWAPLAIASALSLTFVLGFALHPTARLDVHAATAQTRAPFAEVLRPRILVLAAAAFGVGAFFGTTLTSLTAFASAIGLAEQSGLLYGLMGIGSAVLALGVVFLPPRFALRWRWLVFASMLTVGAALYAAASDLASVVVVLCLMGLGVGPTLVTLFSIAGERSPIGRSATTMTVIGSALTLAQALTSAVTGAIAEQVSVRAAMALPVVAAVLVLALGIVNVVIERRERMRRAAIATQPTATQPTATQPTATQPTTTHVVPAGRRRVLADAARRASVDE